MSKLLETITQFFDTIGLAYQITTVRSDSFMQGLDIVNGVLHIDKETLPHVGDALHEAGHIAVTPENIRHELQGNVAQCGHGGGHEMAAIAWSWAALKYMNLQPDVVFHKDGYKQGSDSIIEAFENGDGFGTPLLVFWDMCHHRDHEQLGFPNMKRWLRPADTSSEDELERELKQVDV